jgi:opacity protein-like surface antigen
MKQARILAVCAAAALAPAALAQKWEVGGGVGGGFNTSQDVEHADGTSASAKIGPGVAAGAWVGSNTSGHFGGELRYAYQRGELRLKRSGQEATFDGDSHAIHYDFLWHFTGQNAQARPYFAFGGGVKVYRGLGEEALVQPLSRYALLTKTSEYKGMASVGVGVKLKFGDRWHLRLDVHDYMTPFPQDVIAPNVNASVGGWVHQFVPMIGLSFTGN